MNGPEPSPPESGKLGGRQPRRGSGSDAHSPDQCSRMRSAPAAWLKADDYFKAPLLARWLATGQWLY